ncbi:MAG: hypothetical protein KDB27_04225 [Planctomycetales bacterium]|nr:hypothetical protein [Planctomycetales bacterium]
MKNLTLLLLFVFVLAPNTYGEAPEAETPEINGRPAKRYAWDDFEIWYPPQRWHIEERSISDGRQFVQLTANGADKVSVQFFLFTKMPEADSDYLNHPQMFSTSLILESALSIAENDESRIYNGVGIANLPGHWDTTSRMTAIAKDNTLVTFDACHQFAQHTGCILAAVVTTTSKPGHLNQDPNYTELVAEAYEMIQTARFPGTTDDSDEDVYETAEVSGESQSIDE